MPCTYLLKRATGSRTKCATQLEMLFLSLVTNASVVDEAIVKRKRAQRMGAKVMGKIIVNFRCSFEG